MSDNVVVVFGASGMVGQAIQAECKGTDRVLLVKTSRRDGLDLTNFEDTFYFLKSTLLTFGKIDGIINLAANCGGLYKNLNEKVRMFDDNMAINSNVLKAADMLDIRRVVSCLSVCVFPELSTAPYIELPFTEINLHDGPPHPSNALYAYAKRMTDVLTRGYRHKCNRDYITVTPTNVFGFYDNFSEEGGHVIPCLIRKCVDAVDKGTPFTLRGTGKSRRQFIYSKDLAKLILWAYDNYSDDETIILSPSVKAEVNITDVAEIIADICGYNRSLEFDTSYSDGQYDRPVSNKKLIGLYPDFKFTDIKTALEETIDWYYGINPTK